MKKPYWEWFWGKDQHNVHAHSKPKRFSDFDKMKIYSARHSAKYKSKHPSYWSSYNRIG